MARMTFIDSHVGARLAAIRAAANLSATQAAMLLHITSDELCAIEAGRVRASSKMLIKAATTYGVPMAAFYEGLDVPPPA